MIIFNATMTSKSIDKRSKGKKSMKDFKIGVFKEVDKIADLMWGFGSIILRKFVTQALSPVQCLI